MLASNRAPSALRSSRLLLASSAIVLIHYTLVGCGSSPSNQTVPPTLERDFEADFESLVGSYLDFYLRAFPTVASDLGDHRFDDRFANYDSIAIQKTVAGFKGLREKLQALPREQLSEELQVDFDILAHHMDAQVFWLEDLRLWTQNPLVYAEDVLLGLEQLAFRDFAPVGQRARLILDRQSKIPEYLENARKNLRMASPVLAREATQILSSALVFVDEVLPKMVDGVEDAALIGQLRRSQQETLDAIQTFFNDLERRIPRMTHEPRLGAESLSEWLRLSEMITIPLDDLKQRALSDLEECHARLDEVVEELEDFSSKEELLESLVIEQFSLDSFLGDVETLIAQIEESSQTIVTPLASPTLLVSPLPEHLIGWMHMDMPGPFEPIDDSRFLIAVPELPEDDEPDEDLFDPEAVASDDEEDDEEMGEGEEQEGEEREGDEVSDPEELNAEGDDQDEGQDVEAEDPDLVEETVEEEPEIPLEVIAHLEALNVPTVALVAIHETYPGRYYQGMRQRECRSIVRRMLGSYAFIEGWAHYAEKVMMEQTSLGEDNPLWRALQIRDEALRLCRAIASIQFHAEEASLEDLETLFREEALLDPERAHREAVRALYDPLYLNYAVGRMMFEEVADDWSRLQGTPPLKTVHDRFLSYGAPPIPALRRLMGLTSNGDEF